MSSRSTLLLVLGLITVPPFLHAQSTVNTLRPVAGAGRTPSENIREAMLRLVTSDAHAIVLSTTQNLSTDVQESSDAVMLDPYIVRDEKTPTLRVHAYETPLAHFLRAGTIADHAGKKVTTQLGITGTPGAAGFGKVEFKLKISW